MPDILVIMGPTASGKSALALEFAEKFNGEIISADSMQLYKILPIGTAQPTPEERKRIPHHLVGIYDLSCRAEVYRFCELADLAVQEIRSRGKMPIVCGGTGMYLKAFLYGLDDLPGDRNLREQLDLQYDNDAGEIQLHEKMSELDPAGLEKWKNCRRRLIRALEVRLLTGKSILSLQNVKEKKLRYNVRAFRLDPDSSLLKEKIFQRAEKMLDSGWIEEADFAIKSGLFESPTAHQAIGYRQIAEYLNGKIDRQQLLEQICTSTWQYARRQRTWFRHQHPEAEIFTGKY